MSESLPKLLEQGRAAWPAVLVDSTGFEAHLTQLESPGQEHAGDLYLAYACAVGNQRALAIFDAQYLSRVPELVRRVDSSPVTADEVQQILRERLLVRSGDALPKIADYQGRGSLMSWLRIAAMRAALQILRGRRADRTDEEKAEEALVTDDPELDYLRVKYASDFRDAFAGALQGLPKKERTVLQLYLVDGLNIDKIGKLYGVHRATVGRWIAATKDQLYEQTENRLRERLRLSSTEFDSIVRLVQSQLDLSVRRLLCEGSLDAGSQR